MLARACTLGLHTIMIVTKEELDRLGSHAALMEAWLADHVWSLEELVGLLDELKTAV